MEKIATKRIEDMELDELTESSEDRDQINNQSYGDANDERWYHLISFIKSAYSPEISKEMIGC